MENQNPEEEARVEQMIDELMRKAKIASQEYMKLDQETVDNITKAMSMAGLEHHMELAKMAVEETGRGIYEDKITKNMFATEYVYHSIKHEKTVGIIKENDEDGYVEIAEPVGIIAGVTPVTNPTSTTMFKSIIAAKTRNVIVFGFHPSAQKCSVAAATILRDAAVKAGAPENCILWVEEPSILATKLLMNHPDVSLILATGGTGMVKSAYSCGKPALGVGPGNVPCYIDKTAKLQTSVNDLVMSKSFDNGMICASEQAVLVDKDIYQEFEKLMREAGCYFVNPEEKEKLKNSMFDSQNGYKLKSHVPGQSPATIAREAGFEVPEDTKVLVVYEDGIGEGYPFSKEKLSPVLTYYIVNDSEEGISKAEKLLEYGGLGHSAVIHSEDKATILKFSKTMKAGRIIVNSPSTHGAIGDIYNTNMPSLTLGCGSYGSNSTTANVSSVNLINIKRVAKRRVNMQWFKVPEKIYFEEMPNIERAFIVTDPGMVKFGYVDKILYHIRKRQNHVHCEIFSEVESDPSFETVNKGLSAMNNFKPDVIIALGGGSAIDAAKGMWLFYENPDADPEGLKLKFMDIRKRTYKFPKMGTKAKMVAIPTTSGTGSEVTPFAVITDEKTGQKYPLADYELMPTIAIVDADMMMHQPKGLTSASGIDALTHALEAYAAMLQTEFTDGLALQATKSIFEYLPRAYENGAKDPIAREKMAHASTMAGMAFANAFLGVCHSLAHKLGAYHHIPHGVANALLINKVLEFNVNSAPRKMGTFPQYAYPNMLARYAEVATFVGCTGTDEEKFEQLQQKINELKAAVGIPNTIKEFGIDEKAFLDTLDEMVEAAFDDQCTGANPRYPLFSEIREMYLRAYYGDAEYDRMNVVEVKEEKVEDVKEGEHHPHLKEKIKAKAEKVKAGVR